MNLKNSVTEWRLVNNLGDFRIHVSAHIQRVRILGSFIARNFFPSVPSALLDSYLEMHDTEKILDTGEFRKMMGVSPEERSMLERLFTHFGYRHRDFRSQEEIVDFETVRKELNKIGERISRQWLMMHGMWDTLIERPTPQGQIFRLIEHIADVLDRELDPVSYHELGKSKAEMPLSGDRYVTTELERQILKEVRPFYFDLVKENTYLKWVQQGSSNPKEAGGPFFMRLFSNALTTK